MGFGISKFCFATSLQHTYYQGVPELLGGLHEGDVDAQDTSAVSSFLSFYYHTPPLFFLVLGF
jgi:hypothetical protein